MQIPLHLLLGAGESDIMFADCLLFTQRICTDVCWRQGVHNGGCLFCLMNWTP